MEKELKVKISVNKNTGAVQVVGAEFDNLDNKIKKTTDSTSSYNKALVGIGAAAGGIYVVTQAIQLAYQGFKKFSEIADDMSMVNSRLSLVTKSTEEYTRAQTELLSISNDARVSVKSTTDLYGQLSRSTSSLGTSQKDLLQVTDTISKSITISGASASAADAALLQLSQGFASGALRGEELNSIMEQTPRLAQAIANGLGVSIGQLRTMGAEGQLTAQAVMTALLSQSRIVNEEFSKIAINGASGYNVLNNTIDTTVAKIDGQYKVTQTTGMLYIAFGQTIDTIFSQLSSGWDNGGNSALTFGNTTIEVIKGFLTAIGFTYDALETIGALFSGIRYEGEAAFYGIEVVARSTAYVIAYAMEKSFNFIIDSINGIIDSVNEMMDFIGGTQFGYVNTVSFTDGIGKDVSESVNKFNEAYANLKNSTADFYDTGKGQEWAATIGATLDLKFKTLLADSKEAALYAENHPNSQSSVVSPSTDIFTDVKNLYEDYKNNTSNTNTNNTNSSNSSAYEEYQKQIEEALNSLNTTTSSLSDTTDALDILNTTLGEDGTYSVANNTTTAANDTSSSLSNLNSNLEDVTTSAEKAADVFFAFSDTLLNSLTSNADSLLSVATTASNVVEMSYSTALSNMEAVKQQLIANPLSKDIGQKYADAFSQLQTSSSSFLNKDNFATKAGYDFAVATVSTQMNQYQNTAMAGNSVLDSMNSFLESINTAFEDGILTDDEKRTISGVADTVNAKNDILLGNAGAVVGAVNNQEYYNNTGLATDSNISSQQYYNNTDVVGAVNNQEYYNNTGLATDSNISSQKYYNNTGLATDNTVNTLYKGQNISTSVVNQISGFSTDSAISTVSSAVTSLRGNKSSGISLSGIIGTLPSLAVSTGLDVSQLSNIKTGINYMTGNNSVGLKNLQVKQHSSQTLYYDPSTNGNWYNIGGVGVEGFIKDVSEASSSLTVDNYTYYDKGGFTGIGYGIPDHTGFKQAGVVHEDEWVAPKWMLDNNPAIFAQLEVIRRKGSFASGGYTSLASSYSISNSSSKELEKNTKDIKELTVNHILLTRDMYNLFKRLTNNGQSMLIEQADKLAQEAV